VVICLWRDETGGACPGLSHSVLVQVFVIDRSSFAHFPVIGHPQTEGVRSANNKPVR
jgi:hypothetical protein